MDDLEGLTLIGQGRESEIFLLPDGDVLKLWRDRTWAGRAEREAAALAVLTASGLPVPAPRGTGVWAGRPGLVLERVNGIDMLTWLGRGPWRVVRAGWSMGRAHAQLHEVVAPADLPSLNDDLRARIGVARDLPPEMATYALELLEDLPEGDRLCHGDFHLGNMLGSPKAPVAIDWADATRGDPVADVARTRLLSRIGDPPPGASPVLRALAPLGRGILAAAYMRSYRRRRPADEPLVHRWEIVRAAARFAEGVDVEVPHLLRFLEAQHRAR